MPTTTDPGDLHVALPPLRPTARPDPASRARQRRRRDLGTRRVGARSRPGDPARAPGRSRHAASPTPAGRDRRPPPVTGLRRPLSTTRRPTRSGSRRSPPIPPRPGRRRSGRAAHAPGPAPLDPREAAALAGAFAADYLSWDEDDPGRRGRVLAGHLAAPAGDPALLGWDGAGSQRAEFALPGAVRPDGDDRVLVDVRVRVTPYRAVGDSTTRRRTRDTEPDRRSRGCLPRHRRRSGGDGGAARRTGSG